MGPRITSQRRVTLLIESGLPKGHAAKCNFQRLRSWWLVRFSYRVRTLTGREVGFICSPPKLETRVARAARSHVAET